MVCCFLFNDFHIVSFPFLYAASTKLYFRISQANKNHTQTGNMTAPM